MNKIFYLVVGLLIGVLVVVLIYQTSDNSNSTTTNQIPADSQNNQDIFSEVGNLEEIEFQDFDLQCLGLCGIQEFVLRSQEDYQKEIDNSPDLYPNPLLYCLDYDFPSIDFNEYTLLGKGVVGGGCDNNINKRVFKDEINKRVVYQIESEFIGPCEKIICESNFILIRSISSDYEIVFEVKKIYK